jgi:acetyl esterase/lipase
MKYLLLSLVSLLFSSAVNAQTFSYAPNRYLDLYPAVSAKSAPLVVMIHGGGWQSGDKKDMKMWGDTLSSLGYPCVSVQYTLSGEGKYPAALLDLKEALVFVKKNAKSWGGDPDKLVLLGFSAGGQLAALLGATWHKELYGKSKVKIGAVIDMDGILAFIHPDSGEGDDSKRVSAATRWFGYPKSFSTLGWEEASPLRHASSFAPPYLFLNSGVKRMQAGQQEFQAVLRSHGIYTEAHTFPDTPHDFCMRSPWFTPAVDLAHGFIRKIFH